MRRAETLVGGKREMQEAIEEGLGKYKPTYNDLRCQEAARITRDSSPGFSAARWLKHAAAMARRT
jgi:hypothetical protein